MTAEHPPDPVGAESDATPLGTSQLRGDAVRSETGMPQRERQHSRLNERGRRVGHPRRPTLPWPQDLQPEPQCLASPPVVARRVNPHHPTRRPNVAELLSQPENPKPEPKQGIITSQGGVLLQLVVVDKQKGAPPYPRARGYPGVATTRGEDRLALAGRAARVRRSGQSGRDAWRPRR
jgi:hypothetical protein